MVVVALFTAGLTFLNFLGWTRGIFTGGTWILSIAGQSVLLILTVFAAINYQGRRRKKLYPLAPYKIFTLPFAVILVSVLGNACVFIVLILKVTGVLASL